LALQTADAGKLQLLGLTIRLGRLVAVVIFVLFIYGLLAICIFLFNLFFETRQLLSLLVLFP
jgi:hypothetical protein